MEAAKKKIERDNMRIIIKLYGGNVEEVISDSDKDVQVLIIDYNTGKFDSLDTDGLKTIQGKEAYVCTDFKEAENNPGKVNLIYLDAMRK
ncbi:hypothetical protein V6C32_10745 [Desulforamulus ruminis]|uniref:hypothetical protein n=1 Tax=Desulforamulus ruminis TaxID=1564 RepID=UPI002FDA6803